MKEEKNIHNKGFTLLEILLVIGIMGVIAIFTIAISYSIRNMTKVNDTKSRMEQIAAKAKEFYRAHEELPTPGTTPTNSVPVDANALNMEQKYRLDAWGKYLFYARVQITPTGYSPMTYIQGISVDGKNVAGTIISSGPNQTFDRTYTAGSSPYGYRGNGTPYGSPETYATAGDDILVGIDVSQEAVELTLEELRQLQNKVKAIDAIYEGIDNNNSGAPDETVPGCTAASPTTATGCPPTTLAGAGNNDPNCGTATLDYIEQNNNSYTCGNVTSNRALTAVINLYALANPQYRLDSWGNPYQWGCGTVCTPPYVPCDKQYHKLFSMGPDQTAGTKGTAGTPCVPGTPGDDIIP